jgi:hypothetical protein
VSGPCRKYRSRLPSKEWPKCTPGYAAASLLGRVGAISLTKSHDRLEAKQPGRRSPVKAGSRRSLGARSASLDGAAAAWHAVHQAGHGLGRASALRQKDPFCTYAARCLKFPISCANAHLAVQKCTLRQRADIAALHVRSTGRKVRLLSCMSQSGTSPPADPARIFDILRSTAGWMTLTTARTRISRRRSFELAESLPSCRKTARSGRSDNDIEMQNGRRESIDSPTTSRLADCKILQGQDVGSARLLYVGPRPDAPAIARPTQLLCGGDSRIGALWNIQPELCGSVRLGTGELHHLGPLLRFGCYECAKLVGSKDNRCGGQLRELRLDSRVHKTLVDLSV